MPHGMQDPLPTKGFANSFDDVPDFYELFLHNDEVNRMEYVICILIWVLHICPKEAIKKVFETETHGKASCRVDILERCEALRETLVEKGLTATVVKVGSEEEDSD